MTEAQICERMKTIDRGTLDREIEEWIKEHPERGWVLRGNHEVFDTTNPIPAYGVVTRVQFYTDVVLRER